MDVKEQVKRHYSNSCVTEWERLTRHPYHLLEYETTMHFLKKHLPKNGLILDAGGGPGRYTIELAKLGYEVVLLDLTPNLLEAARAHIKEAGVGNKVRQVVEGSIDDLSMFKDNTFDAVICLGGPLNHLVYKEHRKKAANELVRVAKDDSPIFVSVIGKLAVLMNTVVELWPELENDPDIWRRYVTTGDYFGEYAFAPCHFYVPKELEDEFKGKTHILEMVGLEGMFSTHRKEYNQVYMLGKYNEILREMHLKTCTDPSMVSISEHFMLICRK